MRASHHHYYYFTYHRSEEVTVSEVISSGGENKEQLSPRIKLGSSPPEARQLLEFQSSWEDPHPHPRWPGYPCLVPGRPETAAWRLGAGCPSRCLSEALQGETTFGLRTPQSPEVSGSGRVSKPPWELRFQRHLTGTPGPRGLVTHPAGAQRAAAEV